MAKGYKFKKATTATAKLLAMFLAVGLLAVLGIAGALIYYGKVVGQVTLKQAVVLVNPDNNNEIPCTNGDYNACTYSKSFSNVVAGSSVTIGPIEIRNYYSQEVSIRFETSVTPDPQGVTVRVTGYDENSKECKGNAPSSVPAPQQGQSYGSTKFCVKIDFDVKTVPTTYTVTVGVKPA